jgi:hypothetical protein
VNISQGGGRWMYFAQHNVYDLLAYICSSSEYLSRWLFGVCNQEWLSRALYEENLGGEKESAWRYNPAR